MHLSCQRSPAQCFENSSWTQYNVTVHYVRTHTIFTFFCILQISQFISLGFVGFCFFQFCSCQFYWNHVLPSHHSLPVKYLTIHQLPVWLGLYTTLCTVLLTVALALLFVMVLGLLVFSLMELRGSAVVDLAVLEFRSIVEILSLSFHFHLHYQQFKKGEHLSTKVVNILLTHLPLLLLSLLSLVLYSSTSCKSTKESCHYVTQQVGLVKNPLGIETISPSTFCHESIKKPVIFPIILSSLYDGFITSVNSPLVSFVI